MNSKDKYAFWHKLTHSPIHLQYRYQRLVNYATGGKLLTGFEIDTKGQVKLILE